MSSKQKPIAIGSDHGGFIAKHTIIEFLKKNGISVKDKGAKTLQPQDDYPPFANLVARDVSSKKVTFGILLCRSGAGMCIAANKWRGVRAVNVHSTKEALLSRAKDNANVLCVSGDFLSITMIQKIITVFLTTPFAGGRHKRRVDQITATESRNFKK